MRDGSFPANVFRLFSFWALSLAGCGGGEPEVALDQRVSQGILEQEAVLEGPDPSVAPALADDPGLAEAGIPGLDQLAEPWFGDLDGMVDRRIIRAAVVPSRTLFFLDGARPRGLTFDALSRFEEVLNEELETGHLKVHVVLVPMNRDQLFPALLEGRVDMAAANLTITEERLEVVDFGAPLLRNVTEVLVTGREVPEISDHAGLAGLEIHVRQSSSFNETVRGIDRDLQNEGLEPIQLTAADELLESEDLLEMVNAGLVPATVVDKHMAEFWVQVFPDIRIHGEAPLREGGGVAWAIRRESPRMKATLDRFAGEHRQGTLLGNITLRRYLADVDYVANPTVGEAQARFDEALPVFRRFAQEYDFDPLMLLALGYQESGLDQSVESHVGAQGIMQLMPSTAADPNVGIPDISRMEDNIHAGTKYLRFILDRYFSDEPLDELNKHFFAFASYNAGPGGVARLRAEASELGLDPNVWFRNVEQVAARRIGRETVQYVSNIYKYYLTYSRIEQLKGG